MRELEHLLPLLEPPPGGLARLQHRLGVAAPPRRFQPPAFRWLAAGALCLLALALLLPPHLAQQRRNEMLTAALRHALALDLPAGGIRVEHGSAIAVASGQPDVRLYLVQSSPPAKAR
jgi:hypothetical protein